MKSFEPAVPVEDILDQLRALPQVYGLDNASTVYLAPDAVYRVVGSVGEAVLRRAISKGVFELLRERGLIDTEVCYLREESGPNLSILKHRRIKFVTVPSEWSPSMLIEAARLMCTLSLDLDEHGLMLKDGHALNVTFERGKPIFLDLGSFVFGSDAVQMRWLEEFRSRVLVPIWVASTGRKELSRHMLRSEPRGLGWYLASSRVGQQLPPWFRVVRRTWRKHGWRKCLETLIERLDAIRVPVDHNIWTTYTERFTDEKSLKENVLLQYLCTQQPTSVHDLGGNIARTGQAIAFRLSAPVCSSDVEVDCIELAHQRTKSLDLPIDVAILDVMFPAPAYGAGASRPGAVDRLKADAVLALALVHHLVVRSHISMSTFAHVVSDYALRTAIVEFIHPEDKHMMGWAERGLVIPDDYTAEMLRDVFLQYFTACQSLPEYHPTRSLYAFSR